MIDWEAGSVTPKSGYSDWLKSHIPGSVFADLIEDLSVTDNPDYRFQRPSAERFAEVAGQLGVSDKSRVVVYDRIDNMWAARVWWLLRSFGFDCVGVLDGGWKKWIKEERPISTTAPDYDSATFTPDSRPQMVSTKEHVLAGINDTNCCIVNGLRPLEFMGEGSGRYGRRGRIPSSVNVPASWEEGIVDPKTATYRSTDRLKYMFARVGAVDADEVITYCGSAIAASSLAFALELIGINNVSVYDGSLSEWAADSTLPITTNS